MLKKCYLLIFLIIFFNSHANKQQISNPKISVIIPIYNVEKYISKCLDSVVNQTFKNLEIICIDDYGNDNSIKIAENYAKRDKRIKIIPEFCC